MLCYEGKFDADEVLSMMKNAGKLKHLVMLPLYALFIFIGVVTVDAATYYVATGGNDAVSCATATNISTPRRTIRQGINCMAAEDILYIRGGTYAESISSVPSGTSYADAPLITSYPGETATLNLPSTVNSSIIIDLEGGFQYVIFKDLVLDGGYTGMKVAFGAHHIKFNNIETKNAFHQGIQIGIDSYNIWIRGGKYHDAAYRDVAVPAGYPLYVGGHDHLIENIDVYGSNSYCIHIYDSNIPPQRVILRNSHFHDCALTTPTSAAILAKGDNHQIYNNIVYNSRGHGIITYGSTNAKCYNNTVYGGAQTGIYIYPGSTNTDVRNNIAYGNATTQILNEGTGTILSKNLTSDPRFVNAAAHNFNLQTSSPAINIGDFLSQVTTDIAQTPRPQGGAYDIGAYEVGTGSDSVSPNSPVGLRVN